MLDIINNQHPTHLAVVIDYPGPGFRDELCLIIKQTERRHLKILNGLFPILKRILEAMNISMLQAEGYEADDLIGTLATRASRKAL